MTISKRSLCTKYRNFWCDINHFDTRGGVPPSRLSTQLRRFVMSWYTTYYAGYKNKDTGKIYFLGPYDADGKPYCLFTTSASFTTDIKDRFHPIQDKQIGEGLLKAVGLEWNDNETDSRFYDELRRYMGFLPLKELGSSDYIKTGYCLNEDIERYEKFEDCDFYNVLSASEYARKLDNELKFGKEEPKTDEDGYECETYCCRDYSYYAYPDYASEEYDVFKLKLLMSVFDTFTYGRDDIELVIIKTEG